MLFYFFYFAQLLQRNFRRTKSVVLWEDEHGASVQKVISLNEECSISVNMPPVSQYNAYFDMRQFYHQPRYLCEPFVDQLPEKNSSLTTETM